MEGSKHVDYQENDTTYFGARELIEEELKYIHKRRNQEKDTPVENLTGLALSGGGIRSASFSLGVMQAMSYNGWLKKIDYLSTVSGGGYIGSSVSWLLAQKLDERDIDFKRFGVDKHNFPYGTYPMAGTDPKFYKADKASEDDNSEDNAKDNSQTVTRDTDRYKGKLLRYLRQQAKYLTPGDGINIMSLFAVILRGALLSLFIYFGLLILVFTLLGYPLLNTLVNLNPGLPALGNDPLKFNLALWASFIGGALFVLSALLYSMFTFVLSRIKRKKKNSRASIPISEQGKAYHLRQTYERWAGRLLTFSLVLLILGSIPYVYNALDKLTDGTASVVSDFKISGTQTGDGSMQITGTIDKPAPAANKGKQTGQVGLIGVLSSLFGVLSGIMAFFKSGSQKKGRLPMGLLVAFGTAALWFGLLLIAYYVSKGFWGAFSGTEAFWWLLVWAVVISVVALVSNINYVSIHRYYRDRLMELFMPDVHKCMEGKIATRATAGADKMAISDLLDEQSAPGLAENPAPYHLINTNVVLESSDKPKFHGRGGDNFILSPKYCGSNATGWAPSDTFMDGRMTLPTAMAISGAAVNPSTGIGGQGITRQPLLSMLMGLLNIRLGYWAPNPGKTPGFSIIPNYLFPGLSEMFLRFLLNENASYVQLTDGGHFENLALYELIRRRSRLIIVCDGGADPEFQFSDLANAIEKVRVDFGTLIFCKCEDLQPLVPREKIKDEDIKCADKGYLLSKIVYPDNSQGRLLYIKTTFFKQLSSDLYGYKKTHPQFPDEPTGDQFFDEKQFEAYRELGFQTAWRMMNDKDICDDDFVKLLCS